MRRGRADEGQASVELALVLPLVVMLLLAVVQLGLLVRDQILVVHAAREAAREAAVDPAAEAPRKAALASSTLAESRLSVTATGRGAAGSRVRVEVAYRARRPYPCWAPPSATSRCVLPPPCESSGSPQGVDRHSK